MVEQLLNRWSSSLDLIRLAVEIHGSRPGLVLLCGRKRATLARALDAGRVVVTGTHAELVAADGRYGALWHALGQLSPGLTPASRTGPTLQRTTRSPEDGGILGRVPVTA